MGTAEDAAYGGVRCSWCPWCPHAALGTSLLSFKESHTGELGVHVFSALREADVVEIEDATGTASVDVDYDNGAGLHGKRRSRRSDGGEDRR